MELLEQEGAEGAVAPQGPVEAEGPVEAVEQPPSVAAADAESESGIDAWFGLPKSRDDEGADAPIQPDEAEEPGRD